MMTQKDVMKRLDEDHEQVNRNLGEVKISIMTSVSPEDFPYWRVQFISMLRDLNRTLADHFKFEETCDFLHDQHQDEAPPGNQINSIKDEHTRILQDLRHITAEVETLETPDLPKLNLVFEKLSSILQTVHQHEVSEQELIHAVFQS